jgi:hypothetical protein
VVTLEPAVLDEYVAPADPETADDLDALRRAIARLPTRQRQAVLMHYLEETSVNEVAASPFDRDHDRRLAQRGRRRPHGLTGRDVGGSDPSSGHSRAD